MNAIQPPNTRTDRDGVSVVFAWFAVTFLALSVDAKAQEPIAAVFKAHEVGFFYRSSIAQYPCHELQARVATILRAIGARDDIRVSASGCEDLPIPDDTIHDTTLDRWEGFESSVDPLRRSRGEREQSAHVRVRLMSPVAVTPEVLAEIDKDKSRRELISRVTRDPTAARNDPIVFPAQRQEVTLSRRSIRLEPEDCQLLEQMARSVFRELDVRVVRGNYSCDPRRASRIAPEMTVEALLPAGTTQQPPASQDTTDPQAPSTSETELPQTVTEEAQH